MNKGLKLNMRFKRGHNPLFKRNTDLMNKGLKLNLPLEIVPFSFSKETLT